MSVFSFAGDITQKGYEKKRTRLLAPYVPKQAQGMTAVFRSD
jgi:DMAP1-binding Domain.